ncbi:hypothetical protein HYS31_07310 [Candidatus Woesearchaeota archaeon]|nr:hypothetical protein [Candidatus Woesearchaeota archaeon]
MEFSKGLLTSVKVVGEAGEDTAYYINQKNKITQATECPQFKTPPVEISIAQVKDPIVSGALSGKTINELLDEFDGSLLDPEVKPKGEVRDNIVFSI